MAFGKEPFEVYSQDDVKFISKYAAAVICKGDYPYGQHTSARMVLRTSTLKVLPDYRDFMNLDIWLLNITEKELFEVKEDEPRGKGERFR